MSTYYLFIHQTITNRIQGDEREGWEFFCEDCGYRVCYIIDRKIGNQNMEIIQFGDINALHASSDINGQNLDESLIYQTYDDTNPDEDYWLTPELRQQIEAILKDF